MIILLIIVLVAIDLFLYMTSLKSISNAHQAIVLVLQLIRKKKLKDLKENCQKFYLNKM